MKRLLIIVILIGLSPLYLNAEVFPKAGTASFQFLKLAVDARGIGMGEAYTSLAEGGSATWWNPAGVALSNKDEVFFSHTNWPADIMHEYFSFVQTTDYGNFAYTASVLHMDYMKEYNEDFEDTGKEFTCGNLATGVTYAQSFTDKFSFGFSLKYIREELHDYETDTYGIDIGSLYNTGWHNITIGMSLRNFGDDVGYELDTDNDGRLDEDPFDLLDNDGDGKIDEDSEELPAKMPMNFSLAVSGDLYKAEDRSLVGSFQIDNCVDREETFNLGLEYRIGIFALRTGKQFNYDPQDRYTGAEKIMPTTYGLGFTVPTRIAIFDVDWAYTRMGYLEESFADSAHRISIKMKF